MEEHNRCEVISLMQQRVTQLERELANSHSLSNRKQAQDDDSAASLDITINSAIDEEVLLAHKLELAKLNSSLMWMQSEDAGYCDKCGEEIPAQRLKAVLDTRLCINCAS